MAASSVIGLHITRPVSEGSKLLHFPYSAMFIVHMITVVAMLAVTSHISPKHSFPTLKPVVEVFAPRGVQSQPQVFSEPVADDLGW